MAVPKILIVDDDPTNISVLADILKPDYETFAARSGETALNRARSENPPDLILLDVRMPSIDGYDVCRRLTEDPRTKRIPVIFVTAVNDSENEALGLGLGAVDYITRPFRPAIVQARVKSHLALAQARQASENRYRELFSSMADGIVIYDFAGRFIEVNPAFCDNIGYSREELLHMTLVDIESESDNGRHEERFAEIRRTGQGLFEVRHQRRDGSTFPIEMGVRCVDSDGKPAVLAVCRDITERNKAGEELKRYRDQLEDLLARRTEELEEKGRTLAELERDLKKRKQFRNIVGKSEAMQTLYSRLEALADLFSTVLITGESGTGKDLVAEALHYGSIRHEGPLVRVACSDLSENLIESELFGHVRGAFTGAVKDRVGRFEIAGRGTLFLDEIGDIPPRFQKRLLRVLEGRTFERVGESRPIRMAARIVAATHRDLAAMIQRGAFREDLYYRLKVVEIHLPPLREKREDIPLLARHFISMFSTEFAKKIKAISPEALRQLMAHSWPGNVREFRHVIENACILCKTDIISENDLPREFQLHQHSPALIDNAADEFKTLRGALREAGGNKAKAARLLNISRRTLYRQLEKFSILQTRQKDH